MLLVVPLVPRLDLHAADLEQALAQCPGLANYMEQLAAKQVPVEDTQPTLPKLLERIIAMERADQTAREQQIAVDNSADANQRTQKVDQQHLPVLKEIAARHGFPSTVEVGKDGVSAFWLLVQHADSDRAFQARMLQAITARARSGEIDASKFALLTDRVLVAQGRPQRYGTQAKFENGRLQIKQLDDESQLDARRRDMGLMPMADYSCMLKVLYAPATSSDERSR